MKVQCSRTLKLVALFGLLGPPIGALALVVRGYLSGETPPNGLAVWFALSLLAYLYAGLPALVTGASAALCRALVPGVGLGPRSSRVIFTVAVGVVASFLLPLINIASEPDVTFAMLGGIAALVCAALAEWMFREPTTIGDSSREQRADRSQLEADEVADEQASGR